MSDRDTATDDESSTGRESLADGIERRGVLAALAAGVGGVGLARRSLARELGVDALDAPGYVVEQGDRCVPITPLSGEETAEALYDYRTPDTDPSSYTYSSYGTTDLQRPETSICFLYDGPEGLSLVVVHDKLNDGTSGGAATFDLAFENPDRGAWAVGDDDYDGPTNYDTFTSTAEGWTVDWTWGEGRTDGGVYRPLGDDFAVTVDPAFNEAADLYGDHYEGEITDWQVLSGDRTDPDRFSLALDRPITIRPGTCGGTATTATRTTTGTTTETTETATETEETTTEKTTEDDPESSEPIAAEVEVLPGRVNPRSHGRLPVVVYSGEGFDATTLREVTFGPGQATPAKRVRTDADGDGRADLKLLFRMDDLEIDWDVWELELAARTDAGRDVVGVADVELVPWDDDEDDDDREDEGEDENEDDQDDRERDDDDDDEDAEDRDDDDDDDEDEDDDDDEDDEDDEEEREDDDDEDDDDDDDDDEDREDGPPHGDGRGNGRSGDEDRGRDEGRGRGRGNGNSRDNGRGNRS